MHRLDLQKMQKILTEPNTTICKTIEIFSLFEYNLTFIHCLKFVSTLRTIVNIKQNTFLDHRHLDLIEVSLISQRIT